MAVPVMLKFLFPQPPSLFVSAMSVISFVSLAIFGLSEIRGKHLQFSKFWNVDSTKSKKITMPGKAGMFLLYFPAFLAGFASFWIFPHQSLNYVASNCCNVAFFQEAL